jgi:predicted O-linked N-acetylglucosamine transferase (SPINDLY family)
MQQTTDILGAALAHHQAGRLGDARAAYEQLLAREPAHPDALHFLGLLTCQSGQPDEGIALMRRSIEAYPSAIYHNNLGNALRERGRLDDAIAQYREAVGLQPDYADAHNNLGDALREARQPDASMQHCAQAIALRPDYAQAYNNLGNALKDLGQPDAAVLAYGKAIEHAPGYADAYNNLGNVLTTQRKFDAAVDSYRAAAALDPSNPIVHGNLGAALLARGDRDAAIAALHRRVELAPADAQARVDLGGALRDAGRSDAAIEQFERAAALSPLRADAHAGLADVLYRQRQTARAAECMTRALELTPRHGPGYRMLGDMYHDLGKYDASVMCYETAIELDPNDIDAHHRCAIVLLKQNRPDDALPHARAALALNERAAPAHMTLGDVLGMLGDVDGEFAHYRRAVELDVTSATLHDRLIFALATHPSLDQTETRRAARRFGAYVEAHARPFAHAGSRRAADRLRIGWVSGDLVTHPVGIFLEGVLEHLDRHRFELIAYPTSAVEDETTARLKPHFAAWHPLVDLSDEQAAQRIRADGIDILVDLSGHTAQNRLGVFAWKPAPVQVTWIGFFASTGLRAIDYVLGDRHVLPPGEEAHFVERPWRLPDSYLCFTPPHPALDVGPLPQHENGAMTFGYFGKLGKMNDAVVRVWSRVLAAVPGARLFLKAGELDSAHAVRRTAERFARHGIDAGRLTMEGRSPRGEYLTAYRRVDMMLSPFPYPGGTTTAESLWMGVPVLGMKGERFVTHICESVLHTAGLGDWIARDEVDYVAKAVAGAADPQRLGALRQTLRAQVLASPLCDARRFATHLGDAFHGMWMDGTNAGADERAAAGDEWN